MNPECHDAQGTERGYQRHRHAGQKAKRPMVACEPCQAAHRVHIKEQERVGLRCLDCGGRRSVKSRRCHSCAVRERRRQGAERRLAEAIAKELNRRLDLLIYEHGTDAGYYRHRYLKTVACRPCLDAHSARNRELSGGQPMSYRPKKKKRGEPDVIEWRPVKGVLQAVSVA